MKKALLSVFVLIGCINNIQAQNPISQRPSNAVNTSSANNSNSEPGWVTADKKPSHQGEMDKPRIKWTKDPFDHQLFIENKGQFDTDVTTKDKILYQVRLGDVRAYFTQSGVIYRYDEYTKKGRERMEDIEAGKMDPPNIHTVSYTWDGADPGVTIDAKDEQTSYYTYPTGPKSSVSVSIFKKIVYRNIYPGIDIEYSFIAGKPGIKYAIIVHPGADLSKVKLLYSGSPGLRINSSGDIIGQTSIGEITDHAPVCYFRNSGEHFSGHYEIINGNEEAFSVNGVTSSTDDLVIDPWTTDPKFTAPNDDAYDVDYDDQGNVYAYGSGNPFQLTKFNNAGVQQWTFNASTIDEQYYGDFAVDKVTCTAYIVEGFYGGVGAGAKALKVNTLGVLTGTFPGNAGMLEMWRCVYNACTSAVVIGGGGTNTPNTQGCMLDTNMANMVPVNPLNTTACCHDVALIGMDPTGSTAYMGLAYPYGASSADPDILMSLPVPALNPALVNTSSAYTFEEVGSIPYVESTTGDANGMNGMAVSPNFLYMYDGLTLSKLNKGTGAVIATTAVTGGTKFKWGGLDADGCDNVYVGNDKTIDIYSSALTQTSTIALTNTVYDVVLYKNYTKLYSGGVGFVAEIDFTNTSVQITSATTPTPCGSCTGTATSTLLICGTATNPSYLWEPGGQTTQTATGLCKGTYTVTMALGCGEQFTDTVTITQGGPGSITLSKTETNILCYGLSTGSASVTINGGTAPYTYSWSPGGGSSSSATNLPAGTYTVSIADAACHTDTAIYTITQPPQLRDSMTAITNEKCLGNSTGTATLGVKGGTPVYTYSWTPTGGTGITASNLPAGTYTVTITDANGCSVTKDTTITQPPGMVPAIAATNAVCFGQTGTITTAGTAGGAPAYTYVWSNGTSSTTSSITATAGSYTVTITDKNGCTTKDSAIITQPPQLRDSIPLITNEPCFGDSKGTLTAGVIGGTPGYQYSWAGGGATTNPVTALPVGSYTLTITDANGCTATANATITQPPQLTITAATAPAICNDSCNGQLLSIPAGGTPPYNYLWNNGSTTTSQLNVCAGTYSVIVTDANDCVVDTTGLVVTQPTPVTGAVTTATNAYCKQTDGTACVNGVTGGTPGYTYLWSNGMTTTCISNIGPSTYTVTISDSHKCTDTATIVVPNIPGDTALIAAAIDDSCFDGSNGILIGEGKNGTPPYTYSWSNGETGSADTVLSFGTYTVIVTDSAGCKSITTGTITQPTPVLVTPGFPQTICNGQTATISVSANGGTPGYTYTWQPGGMTGASQTVAPAITTTYTITTADANQCPGNTVDVTVTISPPLAVTVTPNQAMCPGGNVSFTATATGADSSYTYTWQPVAGLNPDTGATVTASPAATTVYTVTVNDGCGTPPVTDTVRAIVDPLPVVNFVADTLNGCYPLCVKFRDTTTIASGEASLSTWTWSFGDGTTSDNKDTEHCYDKAGIYSISLKVVSDSGCPDSLTIKNMITVYSHPVANFTAAPNPTTIVDPTVNFTDLSKDAYGIKSWYWQFMDPLDGTSTLENPTYTYNDTGTYCALLIVTNIHECTDSIQECIDIEPYYTLYIPNAFTPNGDGVNDVFEPKGVFVCTFEMYIFDRWGMLLYYSTDMNDGWNGKVQGGSGGVAQEDTYVYLINTTECIGHTKHQYIGKVTLIK
ncbi:MAG: PKD domain-containing protein [Bacteroidia bacterium]